MKINGSVGKYYQSNISNQVSSKSETSQNIQSKLDQAGIINKVNIPKDYQPKLTLTKAEQNFFEKLYPRERNKINQYLLNQKNIQVEKGKIVDFKG
jgi:uncharacterized protein YdeI (YjbR/CyaY-like superfamily)